MSLFEISKQFDFYFQALNSNIVSNIAPTVNTVFNTHNTMTSVTRRAW